MRRNVIGPDGPVANGHLVVWDGIGGFVVRDGGPVPEGGEGGELEPHTHPQSEIVGLEADLDGIVAALAEKAATVHGHAISDVTSLQTALDSKAATSHSHDAAYEPKNANIQAHIGATSNPHSVTKAQVGLANVDNTSDASKPISSATQTALNGKEAANSNIQAHIASAHAPATAQKNSDITKAEIEAKLTGEITTHTHPASGGSDPWTYLQVNGGADFTISTVAAGDVTGLAFAPQANTTYEFEALLLIRTATATVVPRVGLAWATGGVDGVAMIEQAGATATAAHVNAVGNLNAALLVAVGGLPNNTQSWPVKIHGTFRAGASPSGNIRIQLASETAGTVVRVVARSFLKWRTLPF